jgi:Tfp pilus assembly protein PilF
MKMNLLAKWTKTILLFSFVIISPQAGAAEDPTSYYDKGTGHLKESKMKEAVIAFTKAISLRPDYAEAYNNRGLAHYKQNNFVEATKDFQKAIQFSPNDEKAYNNMAMVFCKQGNYEQALFYLTEALAMPNATKLSHADLYSNLGFIYMKMGMHKEAIDAYNHAMRITQNKSGSCPDAGNRKNLLCDQIEFDQRIGGHSVSGKFSGE